MIIMIIIMTSQRRRRPTRASRRWRTCRCLQGRRGGLPDGTTIDKSGKLVYLGGLLSENGCWDSELSRKIGTAIADFKQLRQLWNHANVTRSKKLPYFDAFIVSRLTYGLSTVWMVTCHRRRLDGFHARCLRRILGIPPAFVSRVSNQVVFQRAGVKPLSEQLLKRQLLVLGRVACSPAGGPLRRDTFVVELLQPQIGRFVPKVGRPRQDWTAEVLKAGRDRIGQERCDQLLSDRSPTALECWRQTLNRVFR